MGKSGSDKKQKVAARTTAITPNTLTSLLTAFSPISNQNNNSFYAHLHRAADAHTLRIYEASSGKCTSRWASNAIGDEEEQRVASLTWTFLPAVASTEAPTVEGTDDASKRGKKRRKSDSAAEETPIVESTSSKNQPKLVLALGLENGSILLWSPNGTSSTTLSHPSSTSSITGLSSPISTDGTLSSGHLWSAHSDGSVKVWDLATSTLINTVSGLTEGTHWDDLAVRYLPLSAEGKKQSVQLLLSHLSLYVYSLSIGSPKKDKIKELKANDIGRCTGHIAAGSVEWINLPTKLNDENAIEEDSDSDDNEASSTTLSFLSYCSSDRFVQIWSLPLTATRTDGTLVARLGLDSGVQSIAIGESPLNEDERVLAAVDSIGKVSLTRLPNVIPVSAGAKKGKSGIFVLEVESEVVGLQGAGAEVTRVNFIAEAGKMEICRGGVKPTFNVLTFVEESGSWIPKIELNKVALGLLNGNNDGVLGAPLPTRYVEPVNSTVASGAAVPEITSDDEAEAVNSGELDVDMAEPTLADRLKSMNVNKSKSAITNGNEGSDVDAEEEDDEEEEEETSGPIVPATTLTTTLIQALHSSDAPLLESCLIHTSPSLIRSTVKRLPSGSLVLGLLELLVERLGRGKKGSQGNASVKRARGLIEWVRQVLIVHVGFLVTIPSLVTRLAALHSSLTSRLALQPTLLALNGRLELVMSQIDLRQQRAAERASIAAPRNAKGKKYIEGESSDSEGDDSEGEGGESDEGSVEDVVLGTDEEGDSDEDEEEEDDDGMGFDSEDGDFDEEDDEDEDSFSSGTKSKGAKINGGRKVSKMSDLLDLEASEDEEDSEEDSEEGESGSDEDEDDD